MAYVYRHFIPQNTSPVGAKSIGVYGSNGQKVCDIPLGGLAHYTGAKLYSFGLVSDTHLYKTEPAWRANAKFDNTLTYLEGQGCVFCAHTGDITNSGLFTGGDSVNMDAGQFVKYKEICDRHTIPVYAICGNHDSYVNPITNNLSELKTYTGTDLYYTVTQGNDLFIFLGQPRGTTPMGDDALQWLSETLEANQNKRCFVFVHPHISSGNPLGAYTSNNLFANWGANTDTFKDMLKQHKNVILFHGHSHTKFECQELDKRANYTDADGFKSIHIPSLTRPRNVINGELSSADGESQGYVVDVYADCVVFNGLNFIDNIPVPLGTYKIDI